MRYRIEYDYRTSYNIEITTPRDEWCLFYWEEDYKWPSDDRKGSWMHIGQFKTKQEAVLFAEKHKRNYIKPEEFDV